MRMHNGTQTSTRNNFEFELNGIMDFPTRIVKSQEVGNSDFDCEEKEDINVTPPPNHFLVDDCETIIQYLTKTGDAQNILITSGFLDGDNSTGGNAARHRQTKSETRLTLIGVESLERSLHRGEEVLVPSDTITAPFHLRQ
uniref:Uncharacterized protein n=1 Tax=Pristionchus pacificus TaxID=54126 RepID=A0A2A6D1M8_PRIPA|eukprot:PDM84207.1 hypothetical protein PRIPAC_33230 [Pristionchus pacificus]